MKPKADGCFFSGEGEREKIAYTCPRYRSECDQKKPSLLTIFLVINIGTKKYEVHLRKYFNSLRFIMKVFLFFLIKIFSNFKKNCEIKSIYKIYLSCLKKKIFHFFNKILGRICNFHISSFICMFFFQLQGVFVTEYTSKHFSISLVYFASLVLHLKVIFGFE